MCQAASHFFAQSSSLSINSMLLPVPSVWVPFAQDSIRRTRSRFVTPWSSQDVSSLHSLASTLSSSSPIRSHIATRILHNAPNTLESLHPLLLIEKIKPFSAFQSRDAPVFFRRSLSRFDASRKVIRVGVVDREFKDADVVEDAGDEEDLRCC